MFVYVYVWVCVCVCMYVCMYVCIYSVDCAHASVMAVMYMSLTHSVSQLQLLNPY